MESLKSTLRTTLDRKPKRGDYGVDVIHAIIDEAIVCHVGATTDHGPVVIPMISGRIDSTLYLHGATKSRLMKRMCDAAPICVTFTIVDALVLARTALNHSMNYRSVVLFGVPRPVTDHAEKMAALEALVESVLCGRWSELPETTQTEADATAVCAIEIKEASAKIRSGGSNDGDAKKHPQVWAGLAPLSIVAREPVTDPDVPPGVPIPQSLLSLMGG